MMPGRARILAMGVLPETIRTFESLLKMAKLAVWDCGSLARSGEVDDVTDQEVTDTKTVDGRVKLNAEDTWHLNARKSHSQLEAWQKWVMGRKRGSTSRLQTNVSPGIP
ncbi:UNVERIFIED_CONTAM: hypothetical protein FKN15_002383 [Acipenser sinensis]